MKTEELYFGYMPYSKYTLNEEDTPVTLTETSAPSTNNDPALKVNKNTNINIGAYFDIVHSDNPNAPKSFAQELQNLIDDTKIVDSLGDKHKVELDKKQETIQQMAAKADKLQNQLTQTQADVSTYKEMVKDTFKEKELLQKEVEKINTEKNNQSANNTVDGNNGQNNPPANPPQNAEKGTENNFDKNFNDEMKKVKQ